MRAVMLSMGLMACAGPGFQPTSGATPVWDMFPFDGEREWTYVSTDASLVYKLVATCDGIPEVMNGANVYTVHYKVECVGNSETCVTGERLFVLRWSSNNTDGVYIHAYSVGDPIQFIDFVPPLHIAYDDMNNEDAIQTKTNSALWTSTMGPIRECPVRMSGDFDNCGTWTITTNQGDGFPIAGQWWASKGLGVAAFQLATDSGQWQLAQDECVDCDGTW